MRPNNRIELTAFGGALMRSVGGHAVITSSASREFTDKCFPQW
jgi:hypothetical protein